MNPIYDPDTVYDVISDIIQERFPEDDFQRILDLHTKSVNGIEYGYGELLRERSPDIFLDHYGEYLAGMVGKAFEDPVGFDEEYDTHIAKILLGGEQ